MPHRKKLIALFFISTIIGVFGNPMLLVLPLALGAYLLRDRIRDALAGKPLAPTFIISGTIFGLLIELFAIFDNIKKPAEERILMSPDPLTDLFYGIFYYSLVVGVWYFLLTRYSFSKKEVFLLTGITLGLFTEQMGAIFFGMFASVAGLFVAMFVVAIYGAFPTLAYMLTENKFSSSRADADTRAYVYAIILLYLQWAVFGNVILPLLKLLA